MHKVFSIVEAGYILQVFSKEYVHSSVRIDLVQPEVRRPCTSSVTELGAKT